MVAEQGAELARLRDKLAELRDERAQQSAHHNAAPEVISPVATSDVNSGFPPHLQLNAAEVLNADRPTSPEFLEGAPTAAKRARTNPDARQVTQDTAMAAAHALNKGETLVLPQDTLPATVVAAARALNAGGALYLYSNTPQVTVVAVAGALNAGGALYLHSNTPQAIVAAARGILGNRLQVCRNAR